MDDLNGLDWSSKPPSARPTQPTYSSSAFSSLSLKPTPPTSGRASPFQATSTGATPAPASKSATPANDSFSNLVSFNASNANKNVSLQEQQKRLANLKLQQLASQKQSIQDAWAVNDDAWNNLGSGRSTPAIQSSGTGAARVEEEDDLFAEFNKEPPKGLAVASKPATVHSTQDIDDDPFGLAQLAAKPAPAPRQQAPTLNDDDDILGDLGRPVSARPATSSPPPHPPPQTSGSSGHPQDQAVAELVDMGFSADKARAALEHTESGMDVQGAVSFLLNQAHEEARQKPRQPVDDERSRSRSQQQGRNRPPIDRGQGHSTDDRSSTPSNDPTKAATEFGTAFIKSAGAFWKQAQKQVQKAVEDFGSDSDSSQPKWMREPAVPPRSHPQRTNGRPDTVPKQKDANVTDEAMMLESQRPTPPPKPVPRQPPRPRADPMFDSSADSSRDHSPAVPSRLRESTPSQPAFMRQQQQQQQPMSQPQRPLSRSTLSKQAAEEQASQAYVSSARRRKAAPTPPTAPAEGDLLNGASSPVAARPPAQEVPISKSAPPQTRPKPAVASTPVVVRPVAPPRSLPSVSSLSLKASHTARLQGNAYYKRGDYASAHTSYTSALSHLPKTHPLTLPLLTNVALTSLKIGSPKDSVQHADSALTLIGPSKGEAETVVFIDSPDNEVPKPMRDYYGKALMRKAEALEVLEKWTEAALVWKMCVEDGHGGPTAIQGRMRAEKAAQPKPPRPITKKPAARPVQRPAIRETSSQSSAAVSALRAANAAAEKADDEKFRLGDAVDARISGWRGGKEGNLRALLTSLDGVLWEGSGWKKVNMADVVLPGKVKIVYMKGIAKVHPDKISTDATTEQRMIAGAVFSTLNEAWDKFKAENNM